MPKRARPSPFDPTHFLEDAAPPFRATAVNRVYMLSCRPPLCGWTTGVLVACSGVRPVLRCYLSTGVYIYPDRYNIKVQIPFLSDRPANATPQTSLHASRLSERRNRPASAHAKQQIRIRHPYSYHLMASDARSRAGRGPQSPNHQF